MDNTIICSLNCEGINKSKEFLSELLRIYKCDFLCLQELWCLDETVYRLGSISTDYMYTTISGIHSGHQILQEKQHGGVGILYKKSLAKYVSHIESVNRRVCAVKITTIMTLHA